MSALWVYIPLYICGNLRSAIPSSACGFASFAVPSAGARAEGFASGLILLRFGVWRGRFEIAASGLIILSAPFGSEAGATADG